ncbi:endolytic transglycosylase MltG [Pseudobdellovibrio exovorus]|uniref:Endolytic murein transglycosylase n=1 Tax=Pseudobdellovibrio exovorus JSS TaxID=1184267 RepID=M4VBI7_9BACT|nr:endolytic transglycosylase MltG [Pseudobdellovibrio exovorus]AGH96573.1 hypothetical protein A11Q_2357 [Pseudobdellovibrio exovorus JSS]
MSFISSVCIAVALVAAVGFFAYQTVMTPAGKGTAEVLFDIEPGDTLPRISAALEEQQLIRSARLFQYYVKFKGLGGQLKVGEYALTQSMTPDQIISVLISGRSVARKITFAEGLNVFDLVQIFEKNEIGTREEFFKLVYDKEFIRSLLGEELPSLEGYLYPETYQITKFESTRALLTQMVRRFLQVWQLEIEPVAKNSGWTRNQIVTFASIVEKETGAAFERPLVSSVFHNRIHKKMRLQTDPTVLYGMAMKQGKMPNNITRNDLLTPTPYNSYTNAGLPPTPIANPGKDALLATLRPAKTNYIFFVSKNDGTHVFSETLQQHNQAVRDFQLNPKARENRSWRDLNQQPHQLNNKINK